MIKWLKSWLTCSMTDEESAEYYAILDLAYWKDVEDQSTRRFFKIGTKIYVELGRDD